jgi:hypothetical protein
MLCWVGRMIVRPREKCYITTRCWRVGRVPAVENRSNSHTSPPWLPVRTQTFRGREDENSARQKDDRRKILLLTPTKWTTAIRRHAAPLAVHVPYDKRDRSSTAETYVNGIILFERQMHRPGTRTPEP